MVTWTSIGTYLLIECLGNRPVLRAVGGAIEPQTLQPDAGPAAVPYRMLAAERLSWRWCGAFAWLPLWPLTAWMVISGICLTILTVAALGERDTWSARMRRTIPRNPSLRLAAFPLYTGSAGGILWCVLLFVATILVIRGWVKFSGHSSGATELESSCGNMSLVFGYVLSYCLTTAFLRTTLLRTVPTVNLSVTAAFLGVAVCFVPYLVAFFRDQHAGNLLPWYLLGSPMVLTTSNRQPRTPHRPVRARVADAGNRAAQHAMDDGPMAAVRTATTDHRPPRADVDQRYGGEQPCCMISHGRKLSPHAIPSAKGQQAGARYCLACAPPLAARAPRGAVGPPGRRKHGVHGPPRVSARRRPAPAGLGRLRPQRQNDRQARSARRSAPHLDFVLDGSRSMALAGTQSSRAAAGLAAALSTAAANAGLYPPRVYLTGRGCQPIPGVAERPALWRDITFDSAESPPDSFRLLPLNWRPRGIRVILSDLLWLGDPLALLTSLADRASAVYVIQVLAAADDAPPHRGNVRLVDSENGRSRRFFSTPPRWPAIATTCSATAKIWRRAARQVVVFLSLVAEQMCSGWDLSPLVEVGILTV